jgi:hypothetical protein
LLLPVLVTIRLVQALDEAILSRGQTGVSWNAVVVLSSKNANLEWREDGETETNAAIRGVVEKSKLLLDFVTDEPGVY